MKKLFIKILIWLFNKYAFDYWVDEQQEEEKRRVMKKELLKTDDEYEVFMIDKSQESQREAYEVGFDDGVERTLEEGI
ncbi:hypothetical protein M0R04_12110 [Candidatus Dojkabacteria bacterium]|jgi:hypothetical protein|nr:hypothetical protein [Candidatus Dojkabacteria bacterium]